MKVVLELRDQPSNIKKVTVRHDIVIGRGAECNLRLSAPQVSRRHCFLRISGDSVTVSDLDSSNGTFVNGKKLTSGKRYALADGSELAIGPVKFTARVLSEVVAGDLVEIKVNDERIEAETSSPASLASVDSSATPDFEATVADLLPEVDDDSMNFALESGGPSAAEDDPTADYVSADNLADGAYFSDLGESQPAMAVAELLSADLIDGKEPVTPGVVEEDENDHFVGKIEVVDVIDEVDIIEDDDVELAEDELMVVEDFEEPTVVSSDDEIVQVDDDELLIIDDDDDASPDAPIASESPKQSVDSDEDDLRSFLQGLD